MDAYGCSKSLSAPKVMRTKKSHPTHLVKVKRWKIKDGAQKKRGNRELEEKRLLPVAKLFGHEKRQQHAAVSLSSFIYNCTMCTMRSVAFLTEFSIF